MSEALRTAVTASIAAWGALNQLNIVEEACAQVIADVAWGRRHHADTDELAECAAGLIVAAESLSQIVGAYEVQKHLAEKLASIEVDVAMHRASHAPLGG